ncbi:hypothetical protein [Chitinophaga qingshengii]|uniref:YD repeat-containing protein n=1 Tax=Chitinophaga qingshengii TaxID=1569794 RepID=A0ABR7TYK3_9BACT|nr:hypothetical protein [Chitinophaga qingshengii]MBC9934619.1 hypothetical protein [Chitinophaga qingshengii]
MKKNPCGLLYCALIATMLLTACLKSGDPIVLPPLPSPARIVQINDKHDSYPDSFRVYYDSHGYPERIVPSVVSTGKPMWLFRYDQQHRLVARIGAYDSELSSYEMAYRYIYDQAGRVSSDSQYIMGTYDTINTPARIHDQPFRCTNYHYDHLNRISQAVTTELMISSPRYRFTTNYYYNTAGNATKIERIRKEISLPDSLCAPYCAPPDTLTFYYTFDNKTDFHNLHPVWQLTDKNYNKNNAYQVLSYDANGLPTEFLPEPPFLQTYMLGIYMSRVAIQYQYLP